MPAEPPHLTFSLWFGDILVSSVTEAFPHQGTWFGNYVLQICPEDGALQQRIYEYVRFCEDWHARIDRDEDADPAEFDAYADLVNSKSWRVRTRSGDQMDLLDAPIFVHGEISWNHPDESPTPELAANYAWEQMGQTEAQRDDRGEHSSTDAPERPSS